MRSMRIGGVINFLVCYFAQAALLRRAGAYILGLFTAAGNDFTLILSALPKDDLIRAAAKGYELFWETLAWPRLESDDRIYLLAAKNVLCDPAHEKDIH